MARRIQLTAYPDTEDEKQLIKQQAEEEDYDSVSKYLLACEREHRDREKMEAEAREHHIEDRLRELGAEAADRAEQAAREAVREEIAELRELLQEPESGASTEDAEQDGSGDVDEPASGTDTDGAETRQSGLGTIAEREDGGDWQR